MKIAHEAPLFMMDTVRQYTDYDYALGHLFDNHEYLKFFQESLKTGRKVILDNGLYELGKSMVEEEFVEQINKLKPTEYIVPDVFNDMEATLEEAHKWQKYKNKIPGKQIVVLQGNTYKEIVECYLRANKVADKIAFNFMSPAYEQEGYEYLASINPDYGMRKHITSGGSASIQTHPTADKWLAIALGRISIITKMNSVGIINKAKPHHILGCAVPHEFGVLNMSGFNWIETIDTSNPVVYAIENSNVSEYGNQKSKSSKKVADMINMQYSEATLRNAMYCIGKFKMLTQTNMMNLLQPES